MSYAYNATGGAVPDWLNKGDNAWQMISATLVGLQSVPGLVILYGSIVKKKWAVNSAFMALYAFAAVVLCCGTHECDVITDAALMLRYYIYLKFEDISFVILDVEDST